MPENRDPTPLHVDGKDLLGLIDEAGSHIATIRSGLDQAQRQEFMGLVGAAIAHEISNLMTPVRGYAEAALANPNDATLVLKALMAAAMGSARACGIAEAILDCAMGALDGSRAGAAAAAIRAKELLGPWTSVFHVEHTIDTSIEIAISPVALEQVLLNLLLNARAAGARRAVVAARVMGDFAVIEVRDDGRGMGEERLARILRGPVGGGGVGKGRGLGLTICRYLVESAGGRMSASSQSGAGACFTLELPRAQRVARAA